MINKSLNYAYPRKFAEGGAVEVTDLSGVKQEPLGNDMVLVKFQDGSYGKTQKALFEAAESLGAPMGSQKDFANWHVNEWAPKVVSDPAFIAAHDQFNTDQISYNQAVMDSDPQYAKNRLSFVQTHAPDNSAAISAAEELVATGNYAAENPTYTDQVPGYTEGGVEFQGPDMPSTTMAMGEEDTSFSKPDMDEILGQLTTMAIGEEDGEGLMPPPRPPNPFFDLIPDLPRPPNPFFDLEPPMATTMALGEEDGGMPFPAPVTPLPVVNPVFTPLPVDTTPVQGRTYGAYSGTPMGPTNSIQPFTPYMPPQQAQGPDLQSLITDTDYFLNNSGPRSSVFKRS